MPFFINSLHYNFSRGLLLFDFYYIMMIDVYKRQEVRSEPGTGSEFFFTLSLEYACDDAEEIPVQEQNVEIPDFQGSRVLLAEDNELNREIAQTILEMNGFTVALSLIHIFMLFTIGSFL